MGFYGGGGFFSSSGEFIKYKNKEIKIVSQGDILFTLDTPLLTDTILIYDTKYCLKWIEGIHYNRSGENGRVINLTSPCPENLVFEIYICE